MKILLLISILIIEIITSYGDYIQFDVRRDSNESLEPHNMKVIPKDFFLKRENIKYVAIDVIY